MVVLCDLLGKLGVFRLVLLVVFLQLFLIVVVVDDCFAVRIKEIESPEGQAKA